MARANVGITHRAMKVPHAAREEYILGIRQIGGRRLGRLPVVAAITAWFVLAPALRAGDWPQFLGPARNGSSPQTALALRIPPSGLPIAWRQPVGQGFAGPVVAGDRVVVFHQLDGQETVDCLETATGTRHWRTGYRCDYAGGMFREPGPRATPTIADGKVITFGADGVLQALELATGNLIWRRKLHEEHHVPDSFFGVAGSPLVLGGRVFVNLGAADAGMAAFDLATGRTLWSVGSCEASYASPIAGGKEGTSVVFFFARDGLHAVDPKTGKERFFVRWRARTNASVNAATPLVVDDRVFVSSSYNTGALLLRHDGAAAEKVWSNDDVLSCHYNTPVIAEGCLYGIDGRQEGGARLRCVEYATGKVRWTEEGYGCAAIIHADGKLWICRENGVLQLARAAPDRFDALGSMSVLAGVSRAHPALADGFLYLRSANELVRLDIRKGRTHRTCLAALDHRPP